MGVSPVTFEDTIVLWVWSYQTIGRSCGIPAVGRIAGKRRGPTTRPARDGQVSGSTDRSRGQCADVALNCRWRPSECPQERTPHSLAIFEAVLARDLRGG